MPDLVGTCPKTEWEEWLREGDCAGDPVSGQTYYWVTRSPLAGQVAVGDRFYVVAHGRLRGWAPIVCVYDDGHGAYSIIRKGGAVSCTIPEEIPGFRGLRYRWWDQEDEIPFPRWRTP